MTETLNTIAARPRFVLVTGLSGAGKASVLHALEDLGYETVDNPPLLLLEELLSRTERSLAIGVDARTRGFDAGAILEMIGRLRAKGLRLEIVYAWADEEVLLRRYTETRRRHPLAPQGRVTDGIVQEEWLTAELEEAADWVIDTSDLEPRALRAQIEAQFGSASPIAGLAGLNINLISFAFPCGLPREADLVFDARFLRNPNYDPILRPRTGLDSEVGAFVQSDPDFLSFFGSITGLLSLVLPRFVQEGKKYATIAIGCTGGRHRSVHLVEEIAGYLRQAGWRPTVTHRELAKDNRIGNRVERPASRPDGLAGRFESEVAGFGSSGTGGLRSRHE